MAKKNFNIGINDINIKEYKDNCVQKLIKDLYQLIYSYVKKNQNEKGYLDLQNKGNNEDIFADIFKIDSEGNDLRIEKYIYGLKIIDNKLYVAVESIEAEGNEKKVWKESDFENLNNWKLFIDSTNNDEENIVVFSTLLCIADLIENFN